MVSTRVKFRASVRKTRVEANTEKAGELMAASEAGSKDFLSEMKEVIGHSKGGQDLPDSLDGAVGHTDILNKFRHFYKELYNSADIEQEMRTLKDLMRGMIDFRSEAEVRKITASSVKKGM